jgi:peptidoglycan/LPS O-acetylase OafA/YrhL
MKTSTEPRAEFQNLAREAANPKRLNYLDSIRGLAALLVLVFHGSISVMHPVSGIRAAFVSVPSLFCYILQKALIGYVAVITFFVLSGFVLAYSLLKQPMPYSAFSIKRIFRIYPAFVFVILCSFALHFCAVKLGLSSELFLPWWATPPDLSLTELLKHLTLWGTKDALTLDVVIWSLVHEMRISLVFPFILFSLRKYRWRALLAFLLFSLACTILAWHRTGSISTGKEETTFFDSCLATGFYSVFFAAGAFLAIERDRVALRIAGLLKWKKILLFAIVAICLVKASDTSSLNGIAVIYINGIGALGLIALALGVQKFGNLLNHGVLIWLGRISYSLYLVHTLIFFGVDQTIGGLWPGLQNSPVAKGLSLLAVIALSLLAADLMARFIEFPSIRLGKKLSARTWSSPLAAR